VVETFRAMHILTVVLSVESFKDLSKFRISIGFCFTLMMAVCQCLMNRAFHFGVLFMFVQLHREISGEDKKYGFNLCDMLDVCVILVPNYTNVEGCLFCRLMLLLFYMSLFYS
jgi:hypothetical protein